MPVGSRGRAARGAAGWTPPGQGDGDGGGGGGGDVDASMYNVEGPPTRDGATVTYDGNSHASINAAIQSLSTGDSLYIDPVNSPYNEQIYIGPNDGVANGITIYSDWDISYNANGIPTINQEGAVIDQPSTASNAMQIKEDVRNPNQFNTSVALATSHGGLHDGVETTAIEVTDSSPFSVGQQIFIQEETRPWGIPSSGGAAGASETFEFATVTAINGNTLTIDQPLAMSFPNSNQTAVGDANWTVEDIRISGLKFISNGATDEYCTYISAAYGSWFDNLLFEQPDSHMCLHMLGLYNRFDHLAFDTGNHYGLNNQAGCTRTMATNIMGRNHARYTVRFGPSGQSVSRGYVNNIGGNAHTQRTTAGVHSGGFYADYENLTATDTRVIALRSWHITVDGFDVNGGSSTGPTIVCAQRPGYSTVKNGTITGLEGSGNHVFGFRLRGSGAPKGPERLDDVTFENITIEPYEGRSKSDLGYFETESDSPTNGPLTFRNVTYGGDPLTLSDVQSWSGYDSSILPDITVE